MTVIFALTHGDYNWIHLISESFFSLSFYFCLITQMTPVDVCKKSEWVQGREEKEERKRQSSTWQLFKSCITDCFDWVWDWGRISLLYFTVSTDWGAIATSNCTVERRAREREREEKTQEKCALQSITRPECKDAHTIFTRVHKWFQLKSHPFIYSWPEVRASLGRQPSAVLIASFLSSFFAFTPAIYYSCILIRFLFYH